MDPGEYLHRWLIKFADQRLDKETTAAAPPEALSSCKIYYPVWPARAWPAMPPIHPPRFYPMLLSDRATEPVSPGPNISPVRS
jgi:hypothetical protein